MKHTATILPASPPPSFLNPSLLFSRESQSHIWLSSATAAATALRAGSVCSFPPAPSRADLLEGPSWLPYGALTLPLVPSGLMNRANSRQELAVLCPRRTHERACTLENIQVYNSLVTARSFNCQCRSVSQMYTCRHGHTARPCFHAGSWKEFLLWKWLRAFEPVT